MMNIIENQFRAMVRRLVKPGHEVLLSLTPKKADLWHAATGIATESGELLDSVKKVVIYNQELDRQNAIEELGDIEFYLEQLRFALQVDRNQILQANIEKLNKRYGQSYSDQQAKERRDKTNE
jgi:NTP pyrophosphatase (non-canonical NTP hydrolase)